jgi:predicted transcriptional regulator
MHISQLHLAKIETGKVDPGYALVSNLLDALDSKKPDECWLYMTKELMRARKGNKVEDITNPCLTMASHRCRCSTAIVILA